MQELPLTPKPVRIASIDALRGFVMFAMICVNDVTFRNEEGQYSIPAWMRHYEKSPSGMTFVDIVFPAFLFIVGMSIPFAIGARIKKGVSIWKILLDIGLRTASLLLLGVFMVNESWGHKSMGWPEGLWATLMYVFGILAFCSFAPRNSARQKKWTPTSVIFLSLRIVGFAGLLTLALLYRGENGRHMFTIWPLYISTGWFGILGLIGWAYLVAALCYLAFRENRTALLACAGILICVYAAAYFNRFSDWKLDRFVSWWSWNSPTKDKPGVGTILGTQAAIAVFGVLLATILITPDTTSHWRRIRFAVSMFAGLVIAALLLKYKRFDIYEWGISKNKATPAWALWSSAITVALWLSFYLLCDLLQWRWVSWPLAKAGQNVLLAYLLYNLLNPAVYLVGAGDWYEHLAEGRVLFAVLRAAGCAFSILLLTALLNRAGFRLRL